MNLPSGWEYQRLGDIGKVITGKTPSTKRQEYWNSNDYMFITPPDLKRNFILQNAERHISSSGLNSIKSNSINGFSILVGCIGSDLGNVICVNSKCATNQQINALTEIDKNYNALCVYYWLTTLKQYFRQIANITTSPIVNKSDFENIQIPLPPLQAQEQIAQILSTLDEKIELNNRINQSLESLARLIYTQYFVQFDFPNAQGKPYKSSGGKMTYSSLLKRAIPHDWEILYFSERFNFERGVEFGTEAYLENQINENCIKFYRVGDMENGESVYIDNSKYDCPLICENDLLVSFDGSVGRVAYGLNGTYSSGIRKISDKENKISQAGLFCLFNDKEVQYIINQYATGTNIKHASRAVENLRVAFCESVFLNFQRKINPLFEAMKQTKQENLALCALRDFLLPLLMNAQVRIKA